MRRLAFKDYSTATLLCNLSAVQYYQIFTDHHITSGHLSNFLSNAGTKEAGTKEEPESGSFLMAERTSPVRAASHPQEAVGGMIL